MVLVGVCGVFVLNKEPNKKILICLIYQLASEICLSKWLFLFYKRGAFPTSL